MARLRNVNSGAIVSVDDSKVERLGTEWVPVETPRVAANEPKRSPGRPKKTEK